jgi:hypothetical protein
MRRTEAIRTALCAVQRSGLIKAPDQRLTWLTRERTCTLHRTNPALQAWAEMYFAHMGTYTMKRQPSAEASFKSEQAGSKLRAPRCRKTGCYCCERETHRTNRVR